MAVFYATHALVKEDGNGRVDGGGECRLNVERQAAFGAVYRSVSMFRIKSVWYELISALSCDFVTATICRELRRPEEYRRTKSDAREVYGRLRVRLVASHINDQVLPII